MSKKEPPPPTPDFETASLRLIDGDIQDVPDFQLIDGDNIFEPRVHFKDRTPEQQRECRRQWKQDQEYDPLAGLEDEDLPPPTPAAPETTIQPKPRIRLAPDEETRRFLKDRQDRLRLKLEAEKRSPKP